MCWKTSIDQAPTIAARFSHSSVFHPNSNSIYIFGGASSTVTTFNDLWRYDLSKRKFLRPLAMGSYPSPKACSSLVCFHDKLILFGGWRRAPTHPPYQPCALFDELHMYDIDKSGWALYNFQGPPAMAGHSASIHNNCMIVFGGLHKSNESHVSSNDVWVLDLVTYIWFKPKLNSPKPSPRYGHFQISVDENNILILGGCGGPNNMFSDAWLLTLGSKTNVWKWTPIIIKNKEWAASHMWCNPACKVGDKLVVLGPPHTLAGDLQILKPSVASIPTTSNHVQQPPQQNQSQQQQQARQLPSRHMMTATRVNGEQRPSLFRQSTFAPLIPKRVLRNSFSGRNTFFQDNESAMPRRFNELPIRHGQMGMAAFNLSGDINYTARERQAERTRRMDERMIAMRRMFELPQVLPPASNPEEASPKRIKKSCIAVYICDIANLITATPTIEWMEYKNNGVITGSPEKVILSTMVSSGKGELIMFGGLQKESLNISNEDIKVSNAVHFLSAPTSII